MIFETDSAPYFSLLRAMVRTGDGGKMGGPESEIDWQLDEERVREKSNRKAEKRE